MPRTLLRALAPAALAVQACTAHPSPDDWVPEVAPAALSFDTSGVARIAWAWTAGSAKTDWITRVIPTRDGSLVAVGFVNRDDHGGPAEWDAVAVRLTAGGRVRWARRFGGAGLDAFWDVKELPDGRLAAAGFSTSAGAGANDAWLAVLDAGGNLQFERRYGGAADDLALGLVSTADDGFLLVGQTASEGAGERDVFLVRTDAAGVERWRRTFGGPGVDRGFFGARVDGGFVIAGVTGAERSYDMLTLNVDDGGRERWRDVVGGPGNDPNHGLTVLADGRIVVAGYSQSWDATVHDLVALVYAPDGTLLRHEVMGGPGDDRVMSSFADADGGTWFVGYTRSFGSGGWDVLVARAGRDGAFEPWMAAIGTPHDDQAYAGAVAADGALLLGGYTTARGGGGSAPDLMLARVAPDRLTRRTAEVSVRRIR